MDCLPGKVHNRLQLFFYRFQLSSFIPYVLMCGQRPVMKTRILAAKALVPLVPISDVPTVIKDLFHQLPSSLEDTILFSQNAIHGSLLQVNILWCSKCAIYCLVTFSI